jgi:hypothetical protein
MSRLVESVVENSAPTWLEGFGYPIKPGPKIAAGQLSRRKKQLLQRMQQFKFDAIRKKSILL